MNNAGYDNSKIGYDGNSGYVTYNNQSFMKPQMNVSGTAYTDQSTFDNAHNQFKQQNPGMFNTGSSSSGQPSWMNSAEDSMPIDQRFAYYASNPDKGNAELGRVSTKIGYLNGLSAYDPQASQELQSANQYKQSLMSVLGNQAQQQPGQGPDLNGLISAVYQRVTSPQPYDVYSDPQFKAAQDQANYQALQGIRSGQEALGASGMARSSDLSNYAQNQQNLATQHLLSTVVPSLIQQHNALEQQRTQDLMGMISPIMQQQQNQFNNRIAEAGLTGKLNGQDTLQGEQSQAALTGMLPNGQASYAAQQQSIQNAIARANAFGQITNQEDANLLGVPLGTTTRELQALLYKNQYQNAMLGLKAQANGIAAMRAGNQATRDAAMSNFYNAKSGDVKNTQDANNIAGEVYDHAQEFQSPQDVEDYFKANGPYLAQHLGAKATNDLKNSFLAPYNQDNKQATSQYDRALSAAQRDPRWLMPDADKNALIQEYQGYYNQ